jgi:FkbM family methyltransferase
MESESYFFSKISDKVKIIFDVGAYNDSLYVYTGRGGREVHYFEPLEECLEQLKKLPNNNKKSFFNQFGLSDENNFFNFWTSTYSFIDRSIGTGEPIKCELRRGDDYCRENNIEKIDFLKIDVECMETKVFRGFGEYLNNVKIIQFEYGPGQKEVGDNLDKMLSYLEIYGFTGFNYMFFDECGKLTPIENRDDTWKWCNIVAYNSKYFDSEPWV